MTITTYHSDPARRLAAGSEASRLTDLVGELYDSSWDLLDSIDLQDRSMAQTLIRRIEPDSWSAINAARWSDHIDSGTRSDVTVSAGKLLAILQVLAFWVQDEDGPDEVPDSVRVATIDAQVTLRSALNGLQGYSDYILEALEALEEGSEG